MKLRLYHHSDGARVAYREAGTGRGLGLLHSAGLSHREWEPVVEDLAERFRVVVPDLPLHGDSEDRPHHPYSADWLTDVMSGFCRETLGPRPAVAGHGLGADLLLRAVSSGRLAPGRLVLMPNRLHGSSRRPALLKAGRLASPLAMVPGLDSAFAHAAQVLARPRFARGLSARENPAAGDLVRHAFADVGGNRNRARSWAKLARRWPIAPRRELLDAYGALELPTLLLWADEDRRYPISLAEEALRRLPNADLRILAGTGFLMAYDDPVGLVRELAAFCG